MTRVCLLEAEGGMSYPEVDDDAVAWHDLLGGYMETFALPFALGARGLVGIADEEGYRKELPLNVYAPYLKAPIVGRVIIARSDPPEFVDLTDEDVAALEEWFPLVLRFVDQP